MPTHYHAVVWLDHHEAQIIHFNVDAAVDQHIHSSHPPQHLHAKAGGVSGTHITDEPEFYRDVAATLADAREILVVGPSAAKTEFIKHLHRHDPSTFERVVSIETLARTSDPQLLAEARKFFTKTNRMRPQRG